MTAIREPEQSSAPNARPTSAHRFVALDGLRGVAAIGVVVYHVGRLAHIGWLAPRGYLAVDFFFVLSGLVLARAYGAALATREITPLEFLRLRFWRLWPTAMVGTTLGITFLLPHFELALIPNLVMLPSFTTEVMFPYNPPHWSLWYELVANYAYGVLAPMLRPRRLLLFIVVAGTADAIAMIVHGTGDSLSVARLAYGFALGVWLQRQPIPRTAAAWPLLAMALAVCLTIPLPSSGALDALLAVIVLPTIVWLGTASRSTSRGATLLGRASFPLYAVHYPILIRLFS